MLGAATLTAFLATTNSACAKKFNGKVLGLRLRTDDRFALAFDVSGIELRIQKDPAHLVRPLRV